MCNHCQMRMFTQRLCQRKNIWYFAVFTKSQHHMVTTSVISFRLDAKKEKINDNNETEVEKTSISTSINKLKFSVNIWHIGKEI
ncbi:unnamed protein product [Trichobilharzia szidati]|nr:unnamed protein product [Trichobilharzia szidati]